MRSSTASSNGMSQDVSRLSQVKYINCMNMQDCYTVLHQKQQTQILGLLMCDSDKLGPELDKGP